MWYLFLKPRNKYAFDSSNEVLSILRQAQDERGVQHPFVVTSRFRSRLKAQPAAPAVLRDAASLLLRMSRKDAFTRER